MEQKMKKFTLNSVYKSRLRTGANSSVNTDGARSAATQSLTKAQAQVLMQRAAAGQANPNAPVQS